MKSITFKTLLFFILLMIFSSNIKANGESKQINIIRQAVDFFCKSEFEGDDFKQRSKIIKFSPAREKIEKQRTGPALPSVVFWNWDNFYIVSSYKISDIKIKDNHAIAIVAYNRIGESKGKENIIPCNKKEDIVEINLIYDKKQWWVFDPPPPRISINALIQIYKNDLKDYNEKWLSQATKEQKELYFQKQNAFKTLKDILNAQREPGQ